MTKKEQAEAGLSLQISANNLRAVAKSLREQGNLTAAGCREIEAEETDMLAATYLMPDEPRVVGIGGELVPSDEEMETAPAAYDTLKTSPDLVNVTASRERLQLAGAAGALILGTDVAETIQVRNSLERMLAHQLGALHLMAMKFSEKAARHLDVHTLQSDGGRWIVGRGAGGQAGETGQHLQALLVEASRAANTATRLMGTFQDGLMALDRIRRGGKQTVKVVHVHQHVAVAQGGQAVVAGTMKNRGRRKPEEFLRNTREGEGPKPRKNGRGDASK